MRSLLVTALCAVAAVATVAAAKFLPAWLLLHVAHKAPAWVDPRLAFLAVQAVLLTFLLVASRAGMRRMSPEPITPSGIRAAGWLVLGTLMLSVLVSAAILQGPALPMGGGRVEEVLGRWVKELPNSGVIGGLLILGVIAPVTEELLFRGYLIGFLLRRSPAWFALAVSTALFAVVHDSWIAAALLGLAFGLLYLRFENIWLCVIAHSLHNLVSSFAAPLALAYLYDAHIVFPMEGELLPLQLTWLTAALACFAMFLWDVLGGLRGGALTFLRSARPAVP